MNLTHFNRAVQQKLINSEQFADAESNCHSSYKLVVLQIIRQEINNQLITNIFKTVKLIHEMVDI